VSKRSASLGAGPSFLPDIAPLRASREFRLLWTGQLISQAGSALRLVAVPYQVYVLTGSSLAVGLLGLFSAVPLITLSLWGGVIADRVDRRRMLVITSACLTPPLSPSRSRRSSAR
jgi:MFS family permease